MFETFVTVSIFVAILGAASVSFWVSENFFDLDIDIRSELEEELEALSERVNNELKQKNK